jgi:hypothetical protein
MSKVKVRRAGGSCGTGTATGSFAPAGALLIGTFATGSFPPCTLMTVGTGAGGTDDSLEHDATNNPSMITNHARIAGYPFICNLDCQQTFRFACWSLHMVDLRLLRIGFRDLPRSIAYFFYFDSAQGQTIFAKERKQKIITNNQARNPNNSFVILVW